MNKSLSISVCFFALAQLVAGYDNGLALKPPLGWQTWCSAGPCGTDHCFDYQIKDTAKAMVDNGMKDLGYEWIVLDDCWNPQRNGNGTLVPNKDFFPNGMKPVIDYVHSLGLKFGLYTSVGTRTCHGGWSPGSFGHYTEDADLFAGWGVDYVKVDWCGLFTTEDGHKKLSAAMNQTGRPMILELCRGTYQEQQDWGYADSIAQVWRATGDHHDDFNSTLDQVAAFYKKNDWSGPHGWAYGDMMMTGGEGCKDYDPRKPEHCPGQTDNEYRTEVSLYAVLSSPMMVGTDIRLMTPIMNETLLNPHMLAINQDYQARPGYQYTQTSCATNDVWIRKLSNGSIAVAAPNLGDTTAEIKICFSDVGSTGSGSVFDVWAGTTTAKAGEFFSKQVDTHDTLLVILDK